MSEQKIRVGRLRKLAKHLRSEHRVHKKFVFDVEAEGKMDKDGNYCGSAGCAMGEFPALWPKKWSWKLFSPHEYYVVHKNPNIEEKSKSITKFFSITERQVNHLFFPYQQDVANFGGQTLYDDAVIAVYKFTLSKCIKTKVLMHTMRSTQMLCQLTQSTYSDFLLTHDTFFINASMLSATCSAVAFLYNLSPPNLFEFCLNGVNKCSTWL